MNVEGIRNRPDERALFAPRPSAPGEPPAISEPPAALDGDLDHRVRLPFRSAHAWHRLPGAARRALQTVGTTVDLELERGGAFLLIPVLLCIGAAVYFTLEFEPGWMPMASTAALLCAVAWLAREIAFARFAALALLLVVGGAVAGKVEAWRASTKVVGGEISTRVTARVETIEPRENGRTRLTLTVISTERPKLRYQPDRVRLTARGVPAGLAPGDVVQGLARMTAPLGPLRPQSYDFAFENYFDGIGATGFFLRNPTLASSAGIAPLSSRVAAWTEARRLDLATRIRGHIGGPEGEIAAALVAGVRAGIPEEANETLRITGLAHVLSISGLHMALVAGVVIGSLRSVFAAFPGFASRHPVRKYAAAGALAALAAYLVISGSQVAAERAFLMISVMLIALLFDRAALTMRNLAIAATAVVVISPHEVVGPSFQMSFAATAALIAAYGWWAIRRSSRRPGNPAARSRSVRLARNVAGYAVALAATSLIAGAATGIFGAWHFQRVSPLGLAANLAAMPVFSAIVMPAAVAGVALIPFGLDGLAFAVMGKGLTFALAIARWLAERTPIDAVGAIPATAVALLALALVPLTLATTSAVRLLALPLALAGCVALIARDMPKMLISEDGRLVAVRTADAMLAVNRARPHAFTVEDWQRATMASEVVKPQEVMAWTTDESGLPQDRFACVAGTCLLSLGEGLVVAHAQKMPEAEKLCGIANLIVIADPTAANPCPHSQTQVITARKLALRGSATVSFDADDHATVIHAIPDGKLRPWHDHRRFSRAARGMAPYQPKTEKAGTPPAL